MRADEADMTSDSEASDDADEPTRGVTHVSSMLSRSLHEKARDAEALPLAVRELLVSHRARIVRLQPLSDRDALIRVAVGGRHRVLHDLAGDRAEVLRRHHLR